MAFKIGELVRLSDFGMLIHGSRNFSVGIVLSEPYDLLTPLGAKETTYYDITIANAGNSNTIYGAWQLEASNYSNLGKPTLTIT